MPNKKNRPFLKWPGGKYRLAGKISAALPAGTKLIEPFVGSGAVFLNTDYKTYLLNDINQDLITTYKILQQQGVDFIDICKDYFKPRYNNNKKYYMLREQFNITQDIIERAALFLYLNRHGYNGLIRYNYNKREFNVPFGSYRKPYFPEQEMLVFHEKAKNAKFICEDYTKTLARARKGHVVYCDPPYVPLSKTANFTAYQPDGFSENDQHTLANKAEKLATNGIPVLLSNHDTKFTNDIYRNASISKFKVTRSISCKGKSRQQVKELLACFSGL